MTQTRAVPWLDSLPAAERDALAARFAGELAAAGLAVYRGDTDSWIPIPPVLSPEPVDARLMAQLSGDAEELLGATARVAAWTLPGAPGAATGERLYHGFTPLEQAVLAQGPARFAQVATARVDYFLDAGGAPRALELNATIPAMQGYSDLIAHAWIRLVGGARGRSAAEIAALVRRAGSNTLDLLASVVWHYHARGGRAATPSIAIVSRRGDAQLGELRHYQRAWTAAGHRVQHVWVDEVEGPAPGGAGGVRARGEDFDLVYRHIFARRVEPESAFGKLLVAGDAGGAIVVNPVVSPLEVKGLLALLSASTVDPELARAFALTDAERGAVARVVPWTRLLEPGPAVLADGTRVDDLPAWAAQHAERLVLKRSWDYGGKSVVLGPEAGEPATEERMKATLGAGAGTWPAFVAAAARDPHVWVLQEMIAPTPRRHLLAARGPDGVVRAAWHELFVDISAYCRLGGAPAPTGGACRASGSRIVNILGGGGLTPLLPADLVDELCG